MARTFGIFKAKPWSCINIVCKLKFKLDRRSLQTISFSFIRPLLEYADLVWDKCTQYEVNDLEKIQNEAARIVSGATKIVTKTLSYPLLFATGTSFQRKYVSHLALAPLCINISRTVTNTLQL